MSTVFALFIVTNLGADHNNVEVEKLVAIYKTQGACFDDMARLVKLNPDIASKPYERL